MYFQLVGEFYKLEVAQAHCRNLELEEPMKKQKSL